MADDENNDLDRAERVSRRRSKRTSESTSERTSSQRDESSGSSQADDPSQIDDSSQSNNPSQMNELDEASQTDESAGVRNRRHVAMYLDEELADQLDLYFDRLNLEHKQQHGEPLEKNRDFYPALVKAVTEDEDIRDLLDLE